MMLYVEYEKTEEGFTGSLNLCGNVNGLSRLADTLIDIGKLPAVIVLIRERNPSPYDGLLEEISIALKPDAKVYIGQEEEKMVISGSQEYLSILADNLRFLVENSISFSLNSEFYHIHIEYYPEHFYLEKESIPLVVCCTR